MNFSIDAWAAEYGTAVESDELSEPAQPADIDVEVKAADWKPISPPASTKKADTVLFSDGVRRIDARVWIDDENGRARPGICASYAAGIIKCDGRAQIENVEVRRGLFTSATTAQPIKTFHGDYSVQKVSGDNPDQLPLALQQRMGELEVDLAIQGSGADLIVVDGPLRAKRQSPDVVGYIKTHQVMYLPETVEQIVGDLQPLQRTPLFLTGSSFSRYSWYLRLPGGGAHSWAGVVRCEVTAENNVSEAVDLANRVTKSVPKFASEAYKDPRAPQNLYPIGGLEQVLRHRLGDCDLLYRCLQTASAA